MGRNGRIFGLLHHSFFLFGGVLCSNFNSLQYASGAVVDHKGLRLVQCTESSGVYEVWVSPEALRIFSLSDEYVIAACAPHWQVQVWRDDRKRYSQIFPAN